MSMANNDDNIDKLLMSETTKRKAFDMIVKSYSECLYWKIRYIVFSHEDANDVLQNTFLKAWANIDSFKGKSKLLTWLCSIAINEALDFEKTRPLLMLMLLKMLVSLISCWRMNISMAMRCKPC